MNATVTAARTAAASALVEARSTRKSGDRAFETLRRAAQINGGAYAAAYRAADDAGVAAHTIAGHMLTQRADRAIQYAW